MAMAGIALAAVGVNCTPCACWPQKTAIGARAATATTISSLRLGGLSLRKPVQSSARSSGSAVFEVTAAGKTVDVAKVTPQADRVLVRLEELPEQSEGGVLLPKSAVKFERYLVGEVISVGKEGGVVEKGQKVMFSDINAYEVNFGTTEKHCFCRAVDLLAAIE